MHVIVHQVFKSFVEDQHSRDLYLKMLKSAGFEEAQFEAAQYHNDSEIDRLIEIGANMLSQSRMDFLTDMGINGAAELFEALKAMIDPEWKTLDLIENVEPRMHKYVREELGAFPPALKSERPNENELKISALSHRKMAGLAKGFILGFGKIYDETITVDAEMSDTGYSFLIKKEE